MTALLGTIDELVQLLLPSRHFEWTDIGFNLIAAIMGTLANALLGWARPRVTGSK